MEGLRDILVLLTVMGELDGTWVDVAVRPLPLTKLRLKGLELDALKTQIFGTDDQVGSLETTLRVSLDQSEDRDTAHAPLGGSLGALTYRDGHAGKTLLDENGGRETGR